MIVQTITVSSGNLLFCFPASIPPPSDDNTQIYWGQGGEPYPLYSKPVGMGVPNLNSLFKSRGEP